MGSGPLIAAGGMLMLLGVGVHVNYATEILPGIVLFSLGLAMIVAPLTAAVLAGVSDDEAGVGSAINNAVARVAGLIALWPSAHWWWRSSGQRSIAIWPAGH